jgi:peptidoglycan-associated lipoprotein
MKRPHALAVPLAFALAAVLGGCTKKAVNTQSTVATAPPAAAETPREVKSADQDFKPAATGDDFEKKSLSELQGYLKDTFFDFDRSDIRADQRDPLAADGSWLRKHPAVKVRVEGHCDERGTSQYNLALGERRAEEAKEYLATLGVEAKRIETVSYGKERPFAEGHAESAWSQNRRDHYVVTAK